jgi:hypothetical protein
MSASKACCLCGSPLYNPASLNAGMTRLAKSNKKPRFLRAGRFACFKPVGLNVQRPFLENHHKAKDIGKNERVCIHGNIVTVDEWELQEYF